ncbi:hypothetical protein Trydic_g7915 [Trypoxylus dichotomus]
MAMAISLQRRLKERSKTLAEINGGYVRGLTGEKLSILPSQWITPILKSDERRIMISFKFGEMTIRHTDSESKSKSETIRKTKQSAAKEGRRKVYGLRRQPKLVETKARRIVEATRQS